MLKTNSNIETLEKLENRTLTAVEKKNDVWQVNEGVKQKIIELFRKNAVLMNDNLMKYYDKIDLLNLNQDDFTTRKIRIVPGAIVRRGCYIDDNVVIMPSFINIGAQIMSKTMIDSGVTVGSCAYIGSNCHISSNTVIAGVLEPVGAVPVIIENNVFIGANCVISEGLRIGKNSRIAAGVTLTASTKIFDSNGNQLEYGYIPEDSVVISGCCTLTDNLSSYCVIIVKKCDTKTFQKTSKENALY